jgi:hypothetical protein
VPIRSEKTANSKTTSYAKVVAAPPHSTRSPKPEITMNDANQFNPAHYRPTSDDDNLVKFYNLIWRTMGTSRETGTDDIMYRSLTRVWTHPLSAVPLLGAVFYLVAIFHVEAITHSDQLLLQIARRPLQLRKSIKWSALLLPF